MSNWSTVDETKDEDFWICYHACMLFLHGVISYEDFKNIYNQQTQKQWKQLQKKRN